MKMKIVLSCLLAVVSGNALAQVNALPSTRHILVYGEAQARAIPDRFKIAMHFEVVDADADAARRKMEAHVSGVLGKLRAAGVHRSEIVATSLKIGPRQRYNQDSREQEFVGTAMSRSLTARFADQATLQSFLSNITTSQEQRVAGLTTELSDESDLQKVLREKAIGSSLEKARAIASAYGASIGGIYSVSDVAPQFQYGIREGSWPSSYQWSRDRAGIGSLQQIEVTGSRAPAPPAPPAPPVESLQSGYVTFEDKIYAVFLIAD